MIQTKMDEEAIQPIKVFYSYDPRDKFLQQELDTHLSLLQQEGLITSWHVNKLLGGDARLETIETHLNNAQLILLLVSPNFIASEQCCREMERAMQRHSNREAHIIPIILRPVAWENTPFGILHPLPTGRKAVTEWSNRGQAFLNIAEEIRKVVQKLLTQSPNWYPYLYDVALSYAAEDRVYAETLANTLQLLNVKVYYYNQTTKRNRQFTLWGKSLHKHHLEIYQKQSRYCIVFLSQHYATKKWTNHELEAALIRTLSAQRDYLLPIRLDDAEIPGLPPDMGYIRWEEGDVEVIANLIASKLREISRIEPYRG